MKQFRSAKALIVDVDDNVLILRRGPTHPSAAGNSDLPGGVVEDGETFDEGILREILEETGYNAISKDLRIVDVYKQTIDHEDVEIERVLYVLRLSEPFPEVALSWEHDHHMWVSLVGLHDIEAPVQKQIDKVVKAKLY